MPDWGPSSPYGKGWTAQIAGHSRDLLTSHQPYHSAAPGYQASPSPSPYPKLGLCKPPPEALARIHLVVNRGEMKRRLEKLLCAHTPCLLPSIDLVTAYHGNVPRRI